ncbi:hypothetical protein G6011_00406 [Alternaria panax]|uniref:Uncharacterized protein n=1 Tax=Alternaria panax TaxID=48097 RepID=A0AAD4IIM1_9PLEO|nr:hypothetical protein G6011_00406 [Alternaria panax]
MDHSIRQPRKWSLAEDQKLREEVEAQIIEGEVKDWCRIADSLPGRTNKDCRKRWHNSVAGGLKKGQWSKSEDQLLLRGVQQHGQRWTVVASCVGTRSADQCAKRWQQSLDPDLDRSEWRDPDDAALLDAVQRLGRHWKDIQREHFPGRSKNDIKNRYTVLVRRYQNQGITLPNAPSSPSDCGTPAGLSSYPDDDDHLSYSSHVFDTLLPTPPHGSNRHSWSSFDNDAYSTWSSPQIYATPTTTADHTVHHQSITASQYLYTQPPLGSNVPSTWDQTSPYAHHPASILHTGAPTNPPVYGYNPYQVAQQPIVPHNIAYTASTDRPAYATMPNRSAPTASSQQVYDPSASAIYRDPRHSQHPYYHS